MKFLKNIIKIFNSNKGEIKEVSLKISPALEEFVKNEMLPGLDISENDMKKIGRENSKMLFKLDID